MNKKRSINLGQKQLPEPISQLPAKMSLLELLNYREGILLKHILNSNTFFQGKVGFFDLIIRNIYKMAGEDFQDSNFIRTASNLPKSVFPSRLMLLPNVKSEDDLNDLVARGLRHKSKVPIWLIANPSSVQKHLLSNFKNFFFSSNNQKEVDYLENLFSLPKVTLELLKNEREALFITDFDQVINKAYFPIAFVRIERFL